MSRTKKINFICPDCGKTKLTAERKETLYQDIIPVIDLTKEHYIGDLVEERELLDDSQITEVCCKECGFEVVRGPGIDMGERLIDWLDDHYMLEDVEDTDD